MGVLDLSRGHIKLSYRNCSGQALLPPGSGEEAGEVTGGRYINHVPQQEPLPLEPLLNSAGGEQVLRNSPTNFCSDYILINASN